jgi:hypothetical protein
MEPGLRRNSWHPVETKDKSWCGRRDLWAASSLNPGPPGLQHRPLSGKSVTPLQGRALSPAELRPLCGWFLCVFKFFRFVWCCWGFGRVFVVVVVLLLGVFPPSVVFTWSLRCSYSSPSVSLSFLSSAVLISAISCGSPYFSALVSCSYLTHKLESDSADVERLGAEVEAAQRLFRRLFLLFVSGLRHVF